MDDRIVDSEAYITKQEMADRLRVTPRTIEHWMSKKLVPYRKIGRTVRFDWSEVQEHLQKPGPMAAQNSKELSSNGIAALLRQRASEIRNAMEPK